MEADTEKHGYLGSNMFSDQPKEVTSKVNQSGWQGTDCEPWE